MPLITYMLSIMSVKGKRRTWEFIGRGRLGIPSFPATPTHNDDDGLQNRLELPPRIWHVSLPSSLFFQLTFFLH